MSALPPAAPTTVAAASDHAAFPPGAALDLFLTAAAAGLAATVALRLGGRPVRMMSPPLAVVPSIVPAGLALAAVAARRDRRGLAWALGGTALAAAAVVLPRMRPQPQPPAAGRKLRIMSANVLLGAGNPEWLVSLVGVRRPDVLALQEQSPEYRLALERAGLFDLLPHRVVGHGHRLNDAAIVARYPLEPLAEDLPSVFVGAALALPGGDPVPLLSAHPVPPSTPRTERHWARTLAALPGPSGDFAGGVLAGDFNATVDHPQFRALLAQGWRDAAGEVGQGARSTWAGRLGLMRLAIDHVLVPPGSAVESFRIDHLPGSDHRVVTVTIRLSD